jgi:hypothetical protein
VLVVSSVRGEYWARPKSRTFTRRPSVTITFEDLTSRCTTPRSWAAARASATWPHQRHRLRHVEGMRAHELGRVCPGTYSMAMKLRRPSSPSISSIS